MTEGARNVSAPDVVAGVFRDAYGQAVATLVRVFGDITLAEDAVQDAFVVATERWQRDGIPANPAGWIVTTARNRAIDVLRRDARGRTLHEEVAIGAGFGNVQDPEQVGAVSDDRLRLIFTCCHPALRIEHQVALTLRLLGGLSVDELARAFLVNESAMAKRLVRAKYKIKEHHPVPSPERGGPSRPAAVGPVGALPHLQRRTQHSLAGVAKARGRQARPDAGGADAR